MRQVPSYLIVGRGRLATHLAHYFDLKSIPFLRWDRTNSINLDNLVSKVDNILLAITDDALESFINENQLVSLKKNMIHFSGACYIQNAIGCHPLMTFSEKRYDLETYEKIPFCMDTNSVSFSELFPTLKNPSYHIQAEQKALYHALCVLSGNATVVLWQTMLKQFNDVFELPKEALQAYQQQIFTNLQADPDNALTGPWQRHDLETIDKHLSVLQGSPLQKVYESIYELQRSEI